MGRLDFPRSRVPTGMPDENPLPDMDDADAANGEPNAKDAERDSGSQSSGAAEEDNAGVTPPPVTAPDEMD